MLQDSTGETPGRGNGFTPSGYYESSRRLRRLLNKAASDDQKDAAAMSRITSTIATITCTRPKLGASRATNQAVTKADAESREQDHQNHRHDHMHQAEVGRFAGDEPGGDEGRCGEQDWKTTRLQHSH